MPTEIKMVYDVKTKQFNADYKYNLVHSNHKTKTADDIVNDWYYEVKNKRNSSLCNRKIRILEENKYGIIW